MLISVEEFIGRIAEARGHGVGGRRRVGQGRRLLDSVGLRSREDVLGG